MTCFKMLKKFLIAGLIPFYLFLSILAVECSFDHGMGYPLEKSSIFGSKETDSDHASGDPEDLCKYLQHYLQIIPAGIGIAGTASKLFSRLRRVSSFILAPVFNTANPLRGPPSSLV